MDERSTAPLILTLAMDDVAFAHFDALRRTHFPPERNLIPAHLTLFHRLPAAQGERIAGDIVSACAGQPPIRLATSSVRFLGRGVAYAFDAPDLLRLRERLAGRWRAWLSAQDREGFRPHLTVQNKVSPERARALYEQLSATFQPATVTGEGLLLWRYLGGPWAPAGSYPFRGRHEEVGFDR